MSTVRLIEHEAGVCEVRLNRPEARNAVNRAVIDDLLAALSDDRVGQAGAIVLSGEGRSFCAGHDLKMPELSSEDERLRHIEDLQEVSRRLRAAAPAVAAVQGHALGAGLELALSCDLLAVTQDAVLGFPEVAVGRAVGGGASLLMPLLVGQQRARELLLLSRRIVGEEAAAIGLAWRAVPAAELHTQCLGLAAELAAQPPEALRVAKRLLDAALGDQLEAALARETEAMLRTGRSAEARQASRAFGRPPE